MRRNVGTVRRSSHNGDVAPDGFRLGDLGSAPGEDGLHRRMASASGANTAASGVTEARAAATS